jgi:heptosyltransferase I
MRILIVKTSSMGDIVHALPIIADIKKNIPQATIDWLVEESFASVLHTHRHIDNIITMNWRVWRKTKFSRETLGKIYALSKYLKQQKYNYIIDVQGLIKSSITCTLAKAKNSKIYGYANASLQSGYEKQAKWLYDISIEIPLKCHAVNRCRILCAKTLGYEIQSDDIQFMYIEKSKAELSYIPENEYIVFGHGTSRYDKCWDTHNWVNLGVGISKQKPHMHILLPWGSTDEKEEAELIANNILGINEYANVRVLPKLSLDKIVYLLKYADAYVGVDTGLSHIASSVGTLSIVIYNFDTIWRTHAFWHKNTYSLYSTHNEDINVNTKDDIKPSSISADDVLKNLNTIF